MAKAVKSNRAAIRGLQADLGSVLVERSVAIELALVALLTGEHLLLLGPPGTAKSLLVRELCSRLHGATYFERLLTKFSTPEELFGPLSLSALEQDQYKRVSKGALQEASIAFLDEVYKANSAILNSLLSLINERVYHEAGQAVRCPLLSLFAASNEAPEDESLNALHDRFVLRYVVGYITDTDAFRQLLTTTDQQALARLSLDQLAEAQAEIAAIAISDSALDAVVAIRHALAAEGITVSDRRWRVTIKLLRAKAWLDGDSEVTADHCEVLSNALWSSSEQIRVVERCVARIANPLNLLAVECEDMAKELYDSRPKADNTSAAAYEPLIKQLTDIHTRLSQAVAGVPERKQIRAKQALSVIEGWHKEIARKAFELISSYGDLR